MRRLIRASSRSWHVSYGRKNTWVSYSHGNTHLVAHTSPHSWCMCCLVRESCVPHSLHSRVLVRDSYVFLSFCFVRHEWDNWWVPDEKTNESRTRQQMSQRRKGKKCLIFRYLAWGTHEQVMSNTRTSHVTRMNESRVAPVSVTNAFYVAVLISI